MMSVPLPKMPLRGFMLLTLLLSVGGCSSHDSERRQVRLPPKYVRPAPVQPSMMLAEPTPYIAVPEALPSQPAKAKKSLPVKVDAPQPQPQPQPPKVVLPVLDNSLPEQIWQPAITRQTSLELKS